MSDLKLTKTRILEGVWEGILSGVEGEIAPVLRLTYRNTEIEGLSVEQIDDDWFVRAPIPMGEISDGVHVFLISDEAGEKLADFTFIAGEALADDIRAEMELLREELDMLKSAFRRHCLETAEYG